MKAVNFFDAVNLSGEPPAPLDPALKIYCSDVDAAPPLTRAAGVSNPILSASQVQPTSGPREDFSLDMSIQDIIRSLPADAEIDADPPLLSPRVVAVNAVDDGFDTDPGELDTDIDIETGISSPLTRDPEMMEREDLGSATSLHSKPPYTPTHPPTSLVPPSSSASDNGTNSEPSETEWEPTPPPPHAALSPGNVPSESESNNLVLQDVTDKRHAVIIPNSVPQTPPPEHVPPGTRNLPNILVPSSDPSSFSSSRMRVAPELQSRISSASSVITNGTSFKLRVATQEFSGQPSPPPERSAKRRRLDHDLASPEKIIHLSPDQNVNGRAYCYLSTTSLSPSPSAPAPGPSRRSCPYSHSGDGRPERFMANNRAYAFEAGKARRPGSPRRSLITHQSSDHELARDATDELDSESESPVRPVRVNVKSKARSLRATTPTSANGSIGTGRKKRKTEADIFLQAPRSPVPVLSMPSSRFSIQNLRRSPSPSHSTTNRTTTRNTISTSTSPPLNTGGLYSSPRKSLSKPHHSGASDIGSVRRQRTVPTSSLNSGNPTLRPRPSLNGIGILNHGSVAPPNSHGLFADPCFSLEERAVVPAHAIGDNLSLERVGRAASIIPREHSSPSVQRIRDRRDLSRSFEDVPVINFRLSRKRSRGSFGSSKRTSSDYENPQAQDYPAPIARPNSSTSLVDRSSHPHSRNTPETHRLRYSDGSPSIPAAPRMMGDDPFPRRNGDQRAATHIPKPHTLHTESISNSMTRNLTLAGPSRTQHAGQIAATLKRVPAPSHKQPDPSAQPFSPVRFTPTFRKGYLTTAECVEIIRRARKLRRTQGLDYHEQGP